MLTSLQLKNFKPFESSGPIRLAPITLVYGPNSSGKSSLIQSLLLLKQTLTPDGDSVLVTRGREADLGSYRSLIHRHELARQLEISATFDVGTARRQFMGPRPSLDYKRSTKLCYHWVGGDSDGFAALNEVEYRLLNSDEEKLAVRLKRRRSTVTEVEEEDSDDRCTFEICDDTSRDSLAQYFVDCEQRRRERSARRNLAPDILLQIDMDLEMARNLISRSRILERNGLPSRVIPPRDSFDELRPALRSSFDVLGSVSSELADLLHSLSYLGPLRSHPARHYVTVSSPHASVGSEGENTPQILHRKDYAVTQVNHWFRSFEIPYELSIDRIGNEVTGSIISIVLKDKRTQVAVAPSDVGFGIGQLLPILVEGIVSLGRLLCVEQPEIHLHPRLQAHLADFFIESTGLGGHYRSRENRYPFPLNPTDRWNQWIVETHSETLMLRLQRRIREKVIRPDDVSVIYVDSGDSGSYATELRLDDHGGFIDEWPEGFFEEDVHELFGEKI